ncbi:MAG TPA: flagellar motor protein MotB [Candidatus Omnitrophota bacterium]|nr:flagellar motor protein MotB [Candidatus Omnitrophota bacterium]
MKKLILFSVFVLMSSGLFGCAMMDKAKRADSLQQELNDCQDKLKNINEEKNEELERAKRDLMQSLGKELGEYKAKLEMTERGLVVTFLAEIFFNSGKDAILPDGKPVLEKVARVLNSDVPDSKVAVEGHTDSDPIKYSGWRSNWELSSARALAVLHYFIDEGKVDAKRLSVAGFGEYSPIAANDTAANKRKNRRVEIVILPSSLSKER